MAPSSTSPIYFWKPTQPHGYLSQWYPSPFTCPSTNTPYANAEQYMMHRKGLLFSPTSPETAAILTTSDPKRIKALGRKIPGFDEKVWGVQGYEIVKEGTYLKFVQNEGLRRQLLETGEREVVEASPRDRVWGVGFGQERAGANRERWGRNLLGKAIESVRERIRREEGKGGEEEGEKEKVEEKDGFVEEKKAGSGQEEDAGKDVGKAEEEQVAEKKKKKRGQNETEKEAPRRSKRVKKSKTA